MCFRGMDKAIFYMLASDQRYYSPSRVRMVGQGLDALEDFRHQPRPDIRHPMLGIPCPHRLEIAQYGFGKTDGHRGNGLLKTEPRLGLVEGYLASRFQVRQPCNHGTHEGPLFLGFLVITERVTPDRPAGGSDDLRTGAQGRISPAILSHAAVRRMGPAEAEAWLQSRRQPTVGNEVRKAPVPDYMLRGNSR